MIFSYLATACTDISPYAPGLSKNKDMNQEKQYTQSEDSSSEIESDSTLPPNDNLLLPEDAIIISEAEEESKSSVDNSTVQIADWQSNNKVLGFSVKTFRPPRGVLELICTMFKKYGFIVSFKWTNSVTQ